MPDRSPEELRKFRTDLINQSNELVRLVFPSALLLLWLTYPYDAIYMKEPYLSAIYEWFWLITLIVTIAMFMSYSKILLNYFNLVFCILFTPAVFFTGYYLSFIGKEYPALLSVCFLVPVVPMILPCGLKSRIWINSLCLMVLVGFYFDRGWSTSFFLPSFVVILCVTILSVVVGHVYFYRLTFINYFAEKDLHKEQKKSEELLTNIFPQEITDRLKAGDEVAHHFDEVSVLFADIEKFSVLASQLPASDVVSLLDEIFKTFDDLVGKYGIEKIKTIGDEYFVSAGVPKPVDDHALRLANFAFRIESLIRDYTHFNGDPLRLRIGMNTGPVTAGIIGDIRFTYDLWGETVNVGSQMESLGVPGKIQVTPATKKAIEGQDHKNRFVFEKRGTVQIKGKGEMTTYFLESKK